LATLCTIDGAYVEELEVFRAVNKDTVKDNDYSYDGDYHYMIFDHDGNIVNYKGN